jgi:hypothetical protein
MIHPGYVQAQDGDEHYIASQQLRKLYGVQPDDDVLVFEKHNPTHQQEYLERHGIEMIHLYPRGDGQYDPVHHRGIVIDKLQR